MSKADVSTHAKSKVILFFFKNRQNKILLSLRNSFPNHTNLDLVLYGQFVLQHSWKQKLKLNFQHFYLDINNTF